MLIDASHPEETRVVVTRGNRIEEFDFESQDKKQLKGNIYLARVTRVEPSLQAAFVEYGGNRHGFLAFSEIHPDYYQIPVADRQALLRAEAEAAEAEDDEEEEERRGRRRRRGGRNRSRGEAARPEDGQSAVAETEATSDGADGDGEDTAQPAMAHHAGGDTVSEEIATAEEEASGDDAESNGGNGDEVESVGAEDALEEVRNRRKPVRRNYKIQEVIKRRQILLVQVVKEERGNKGAALTTYLSLAGRYSVLMPNTARGGGISRKITNAQDRKRLKDVVKDLDVPQGMGVILRTAGESRTKAEIKRDYEYLMRLWENVRGLTLQSVAPALVYEEGSLIKRSVRDLYNKDIDEILVAGEDGYREAKDFMRMLMPSHAKVVQPYRDSVPLFARAGIEAQLDRMVQPQVTLKSGGYIIINQTEALVAIDVNSGRSTREHSIEDTALQTNLEAAEEVARQLRLRDLAGLIVIDFIDMEENRNNRAVEKRMKDCLKNDRARIQVGRISHFGLLEMSRQRMRASVLESTMQPCPHCGGTGHVRSESSVALLVIRAIEEYLLKENRYHITVRTPPSTAFYVLNHKRRNLADMEARFGLTITIEADSGLGTQHYAIFKGLLAEKSGPTEIVTIEPPALETDDFEGDAVETEEQAADEDASREAVDDQGGEQSRRRRKRRRRRGGRDREARNGEQPSSQAEGADAESPEHEDEAEEAAGQSVEADAGDETADGVKRRRRGRRGGRRNRRENADGVADEAVSTGESDEADAAEDQPLAAESAEVLQPEAEEPAEAVAVEQEETAAVEEPAPRKRRTRTKKAPAETDADVTAEAEPAEKPAKKTAKPRTRRKAATVEAETAAVETPRPDAIAEKAPEAEAASDVEEAAATPEPEPAETAPAAANDQPVDESKPRRTGWWQRKSFF